MSREEMERRLAFYEKRMNGIGLERSNYREYWRNKAEAMYWHYLDLLTR